MIIDAHHHLWGYNDRDYVWMSGEMAALRRRYPKHDRPFRTPAYPGSPTLFVLAAGVVVWSTVASAPGHAALGIAAILIGLPLYFLFRARSGRETPAVIAVESDS